MKKLLTALLVLAALELGARGYLFSRIPAESRPGGIAAVKTFFGGGSYLCEFRGRRFLFQKPPGTVRILALGGSTTEGIRGDEETWPFKLERALNAKGGPVKYEVVNLGRCGFASAQEYYYLVSQSFLNPDLVIVYDGYNDLIFSNARPAQYLLSAAKTYGMLSQPVSLASVSSDLYIRSAIVNRLAVYLYRFRSALNGFILKHKMLGVGRQKGTRLFQNVEWYAARFNLDPEIERLQAVDDAIFEGRGLAEADRAAARAVLAQRDGRMSTDEFVKTLVASSAPEPTKRRILAALGLDRLRFELGGAKTPKLEITYDALDVAGGRLDADLFPEIYRFNLDNIAGFLQQRKIAGLFVYQPFLAEKTFRLTGRLEAENLAGKSNFDISADRHFVDVNPGRKKLMREAAEAAGLRFYDAQGVFDAFPDDQVYLDTCHNTDKGLDVLADAIRAELGRAGLVR